MMEILLALSLALNVVLAIMAYSAIDVLKAIGRCLDRGGFKVVKPKGE